MLKVIQATLIAVVMLAGWVVWKIYNVPEPSNIDPLSDWYVGVENIESSRAVAYSMDKPHLIYLYTDWCGYCKKFDSRLEQSAEMRDAFSGVVKIRINPEDDSDSRDVARELGSRGYPGIFVRYPSSDSYSEVFVFNKRGGFLSMEKISAAVHGEY